MSTPVGVAAVGDVLDINCWSNIPFYFYKAGKEKEFFNEPWSLQMHQFDWKRKMWNAKQLLLGRGVGGFQYSSYFLSNAEKQISPSHFSSKVISFNQTFPRAKLIRKNGGRIFYYIDTTLSDLFNEVEYDVHIPFSVKQKAIAQEKENYALADGVVIMGNWVRPSLINEYGVAETKIRQILPGANFDMPVGFAFRPPSAGAGLTRPLVLGFIGKDWKRKGLPLLLQVRDILAARGYKVMIKAIGNCPEELRESPGLHYTGFINKAHSTSDFIDFLCSCDLGCLFSKTEALGISTLEFLRAGVPVAGFYHQGLKDTLLPDASLRFDLDSSAEVIANQLETYILNRDHQLIMIGKAQEYSKYVTWERCVNEFYPIINANG